MAASTIFSAAYKKYGVYIIVYTFIFVNALNINPRSRRIIIIIITVTTRIENRTKYFRIYNRWKKTKQQIIITQNYYWKK